MTCKDCIHFNCCHSEIAFGMGRDDITNEWYTDMETKCKSAKNKADLVELNDGLIIYTQDKWLVINMESDKLGKAIKTCMEYLTKDAKRSDAE